MRLSLEKFARLLKLKETKEATFTRFENHPEELRKATAIEVRNCNYFWVARKKKKEKKELDFGEKKEASENLSETKDLSKAEFEELELEAEAHDEALADHGPEEQV